MTKKYRDFTSVLSTHQGRKCLKVAKKRAKKGPKRAKLLWKEK